MPKRAIRVGAWFNRLAREILPELDKSDCASNAKAKRLLGWQPRSNEEAMVAAVQSLVKLGVP